MLPDKSSARGFSLIELIIVITIIGIIAAIVVPYLIQSRQATNGASAVSSLRLIHSSEASYKASRGTYTDLTTLGTDGFLNDPSLRAGQKSNYTFAATAGDPLLGDNTIYYQATATPATEPARWIHYFIDVTGVMRSNLGAAATLASTPLN